MGELNRLRQFPLDLFVFETVLAINKIDAREKKRKKEIESRLRIDEGAVARTRERCYDPNQIVNDI